MARLWVAEGAHVAICSRSVDEIRNAVAELREAGTEVYGEVCDVTQQWQVDAFLGRVAQRFGKIDVLVNNAGIIQAGPATCMTLDDYRRTMDTHFWGPLYAIHAVLPSMRDRGFGRIVNISSIGGRVAVPHMTPYCSSKFALAGLSEGMGAELAQFGIRVTTVYPTVMRTGSPRNAEFKGRHRQEFAWFSIASSLPIVSLDSNRAARRIVEACRRGDTEVTLSLPGFFAIRSHGLLRRAALATLAFVNSLLPSDRDGTLETRKGWESTSRWSPSWLTRLNDAAAVKNNEIAAAPMRAE
jgi:NAD(P)-dependent dehydrogenase (short-subunit alcohol dehydrogenase family)